MLQAIHVIYFYKTVPNDTHAWLHSLHNFLVKQSKNIDKYFFLKIYGDVNVKK